MGASKTRRKIPGASRERAPATRQQTVQLPALRSSFARLTGRREAVALDERDTLDVPHQHVRREQARDALCHDHCVTG